MEMAKRQFIMITEPSDTITVDNVLEKVLHDSMQPILWERDGLFYIIPIEILMNTLDQIDIQKGLHQPISQNKITWGSGVILSHDAGVTLQSSEAVKKSESFGVQYKSKEKKA